MLSRKRVVGVLMVGVVAIMMGCASFTPTRNVTPDNMFVSNRPSVKVQFSKTLVYQDKYDSRREGKNENYGSESLTIPTKVEVLTWENDDCSKYVEILILTMYRNPQGRYTYEQLKSWDIVILGGNNWFVRTNVYNFTKIYVKYYVKNTLGNITIQIKYTATSSHMFTPDDDIIFID